MEHVCAWCWAFTVFFEDSLVVKIVYAAGRIFFLYKGRKPAIKHPDACFLAFG